MNFTYLSKEYWLVLIDIWLKQHASLQNFHLLVFAHISVIDFYKTNYDIFFK